MRNRNIFKASLFFDRDESFIKYTLARINNLKKLLQENDPRHQQSDLQHLAHINNVEKESQESDLKHQQSDLKHIAHINEVEKKSQKSDLKHKQSDQKHRTARRLDLLENKVEITYQANLHTNLSRLQFLLYELR